MEEIKPNPPFNAHSNSYISASQDNFTEVEAAKWLKVSRITLQRTRLRGEISFCRIGGTRVIYMRKHLEDYLKSRERIAFAPTLTRQSKIDAA